MTVAPHLRALGLVLRARWVEGLAPIRCAGARFPWRVQSFGGRRILLRGIPTPRVLPAPCLSPLGVAPAIVGGSILPLSAMAAERQLTSAPQGHVLINTGVWLPDSLWIVYDTRSADNVFDGTRIEGIEVATGRVETLYTATGCAA